ncbi:glycosyltransferase [Candidatus Saccharibacteria bacterium]|nr:glycosyltransferase [Candidatus Saccharibacteria bacterium]
MKKLLILAVGGGSGGHVTPVVAVLRELKTTHPAAEVQFWCDRKFAPQAKTIMDGFDPSIKITTTIAGKLRRYHHLTFLQHITIPSVFWPNIRDVFLVMGGVVQSTVRLMLWRPDVVFTKGGYVCLPVGWAAKLLRIPLVIHDSDVQAGLTNRLLARSATYIATGAPLEYYKYPVSKSSYVGIPINRAFHHYSDSERAEIKKTLAIASDRPLVVITGGGLGAKALNDEVALHLHELIARASVILISGTEQYDELRALTTHTDAHFQLHAFVPSEVMVEMLAAADVVVSRAGATTLLELAALARPTVLVPSMRLEWQIKHATHYSEQNAVVMLDEHSFSQEGKSTLLEAVMKVLDSSELQSRLSKNIRQFAKPNAARDMAKIILKAAKK